MDSALGPSKVAPQCDSSLEQLSEEMKSVELHLQKRYDSHVAFLKTISEIEESKVRAQKAEFDRLLGRNHQKERELAQLREVWEDTHKNQEDVVPLSVLRPSTSATSPRTSSRSYKSYDGFLIPALLDRVAALEHEAASVELDCLRTDTESECILQMLSQEKQTTVLPTQLILKERVQEAKAIHSRFLRRYEAALRTRFVARNHATLAENEVVKQRVANEDFRRRFKDSMARQQFLRRETEQFVQETIERISVKTLRLKEKHEGNVQLIQQVERGLDEFRSTRRQFHLSESMLENYKRSFATIVKVIEERTGRTVTASGHSSPAMISEVLAAFKAYAYQEASLARYFQDLTNEVSAIQLEERQQQCVNLRVELSALEQSHGLPVDRQTTLSANLLRLSVENQQELDAEAQHTSQIERCALETYLQTVEVAEVFSQGVKVIAENARKLPGELKPLRRDLEAVICEFGKGFSAKREVKQVLKQSSLSTARRQSDFMPTFSTEVEVDRDRATDFFFNTVKPYLSLSPKEVEHAYLTVFPGRDSEAVEFAGLVAQNPLISFCLSEQSVEEYLQGFPRERALALAKERLGSLLAKAHTVLSRNLELLGNKLVPVLRCLRSHVGTERLELVEQCRTHLPKRLGELEEALEPLNIGSRPPKYTPQQREALSKKISSLLSNQRSADEFVIENKYIVEESLLRPGAKPRAKVESVDERSEEVRGMQAYVTQLRAEMRRAKTAQGSKREPDQCMESTRTEVKTRAQVYSESLRGIEGRLTLLRVKEKGVQSDFALRKKRLVETSRSFLAPLRAAQTSSCKSFSDVHSSRPTTRALGQHL